MAQQSFFSLDGPLDIGPGGGQVRAANFSGLANVARGPAAGMQVSLASNVAESLEGVQVSLVNVSGDVAGAQIGLVPVNLLRLHQTLERQTLLSGAAGVIDLGLVDD